MCRSGDVVDLYPVHFMLSVVVVGVSALNLCLPNCTWAGDMDFDMIPFDVGTDDGITFLVNSCLCPLRNTDCHQCFYGS